jgi:hypothetical protein
MNVYVDRMNFPDDVRVFVNFAREYRISKIDIVMARGC